MKANCSKYFSSKQVIALIACLILGHQFNIAQEINTDSLLFEAYESLKNQKFKKALDQAHLGKKVSPDYLDFQLVIGRAHQLSQRADSARFYFNRVIERNTDYTEAFGYLIDLELANENYEAAKRVITKSIEAHSDNKTFRLKKLSLLQLTKDIEAERNYLSELVLLYPNNSDIRQRIFWLDSRFNNDRLGVQYNFTSFDRDLVGPWHLGTLQYIRERRWGSILGRINYTQRRSDGALLIEGTQFEGETYFFTSDQSYANLSVGYSDDLVFPKWRLGATYFQNFNRGWQVDVGMRYTYVAQTNIPALSVGLGKYTGPYWIHLVSFLQEQESSIYPAFTLTTRYYYDTRFDYFNGIMGYGTIPDENILSGDLDQRVALQSFRIGLGYYRQLGPKFNAGVQVVNNRQEYREGEWQNELNCSFLLYYRI